jgi:hypothetical protein
VTLYQALAAVLGDDALRAAELAERVNRSRLYQRRDGSPVRARQVASTVYAYRDLFDVADGVITLRAAVADDVPEPGEAQADQQPQALPGEQITRGIAGEHFVCGELAKRGWIATLTAKITPSVDILAHRPESARPPIPIQVKTRSTAHRRTWRVGHEDRVLTFGLYVLVDLGDMDESPSYWVVPAEAARDLWTRERIGIADVQSYLDRWDLLEANEAG